MSVAEPPLIVASAPPLVAALNVSVCLVAADPVLVADAAMSCYLSACPVSLSDNPATPHFVGFLVMPLRLLSPCSSRSLAKDLSRCLTKVALVNDAAAHQNTRIAPLAIQLSTREQVQ